MTGRVRLTEDVLWGKKGKDEPTQGQQRVIDYLLHSPVQWLQRLCHCTSFSDLLCFYALCVQAVMDEILMLQEEIGELQTCFSEELADSDSDSEPADQLALQSTLTVLGERMATIRMKASGKRQLLEVGVQQQYLLLLYASSAEKNAFLD